MVLGTVAVLFLGSHGTLAATGRSPALMSPAILDTPPPPIPGLGLANNYLPEVPQTEPLRLVLRLRDRRVYLYQGSQLKTSYPVAIGRPGWETPTGEYKVISLRQNPTWQHPFTGKLIPPGRSNPLGPRWIGFWTDGKNFIGFHGTPNEELIGQPVSHGCVRMKNKDIVALYPLVAIGTPVIVEP